MLSLDTILLPMDLSHEGDAALEQAFYIARRHGGPLHVLHVATASSSVLAAAEDDDMRQQIEQNARAELRALIDRHDSGEVPVVTAVDTAETPAYSVLDYAEEHNVELIVLPVRRRRGLKRMFLGGTAEEIIHEAPCPVLVLRERANDQPRGFRRLLKPIDFSDACQSAIPLAKQMAGAYDAELQVVHVVDDTAPPAAYELDTHPVRIKSDNVSEQVVEHMRRMIDDAVGPRVPADYHVLTGHAASKLVDFAEEHGTDLIVMATHGRSGAMQSLLGSTTERVARAAHCPVLVVHARGEVENEAAKA